MRFRSLLGKANRLQRDLIERHLLEGLYVSIVPVLPDGAPPSHTVDEGGNVIHAGVWTGRYLAGVAYQYAVTRDPEVREHGDLLLRGLRKLQEVTGKPGLLARGFVKGHGPVAGWETGGADSAEWHQGRGRYADYRWYGDVSVDNFNAVLYGYALYYDLAADAGQKKFIARDVDRLMTHLLDHACRIVDVDDEVTVWGHVGVDPSPEQDEYYRRVYAPILARHGLQDEPWAPPLRSSLMLLPDLLIAHRITGDRRYLFFYKRVVARFRENPDRFRDSGPFSLGRVAKVNHSSEGQAYEALFNLIRYETDPELLALYQGWVEELWEMNRMEGNALYTFTSLALLPNAWEPARPGQPYEPAAGVPHAAEALALALETLDRYPIDRVFRPVMNSLRSDVERNPTSDRAGEPQAARPLPIDERPLDNEYEWKSNPYRLDGWLKPTVTAFQVACDDPNVAWFSDDLGRVFRTLDHGRSWREMSAGLTGTRVSNLASSEARTFVLCVETDRGAFVTRDGGESWRPAVPAEGGEWIVEAGSRLRVGPFPTVEPGEWQGSEAVRIRINGRGALERSTDGGQTASPAMVGWPIPLARSVFSTAWGFLASGPGGAYLSRDGRRWVEQKLWREEETGAADYLHAYWMGRYYGFVGRR